MADHFQRALVLYGQSRHELAETELRQALAVDPNNAMAHALLGLCLAKREELAAATDEAKQGIHLAPDSAFAHYALASILDDRNQFPEAIAAIEEAIRLNPEDADYRSLLGSIRFQQRDWAGALAAAEAGLQLDAEHSGCNNLRAMALVKLGRPADAAATLASTLARDPEDALTHANQGWALLERRETAKAMEHFREALRIDPEQEWARRGIVEGLKARYFIYSLFLRYFFWMSRMSFRTQFLIIGGGYFAFRYLSDLAEQRPDLAPWIMPVTIAYIIFALLTWVADPLFNLLLRLNRYGRLALTEEQVDASTCVGACIGLALVAVIWWAVTGSIDARTAAIIFGALIIPVAGIYRCDPGWPRNIMTIYTVLISIAGLVTLWLFIIRSPLFMIPGGLFILGAFVSPWLANILPIFTPRR
jgi:tetratricopeptide (TPR) repeat protein